MLEAQSQTEWLILPAALDALTATVKAAGVERPDPSPEAESPIFSVTGASMTISVRGPLFPRAIGWLRAYGYENTGYDEIASALAQASTDPKVADVVLSIDSPGGTVAGLFDVVRSLENFNKPIRTEVAGTAASAAYAIAAMGGEITATTREASFGSIGVAVTAYISPYSVDITNTESPDKRPDLSTEEGREVYRSYLDELYGLFARAIASGRGVSVETVNSEFGRGRVMVASSALASGLIDQTLDASEIQQSAATGDQNKDSAMDLKELKASHPSVYAEAVEEGVKTERDRVAAHLTLGEASGDIKTAFEAIEKGEEMTALYSAKYQAAAMKRDAIAARATEQPETPAPGADVPNAEQSEEQQVADAAVDQVLSGYGG